jgi:transcription elongation GreA/GreB family factor
MSAAERDALSLSDLAAEADAAAEQDAAEAAERAAEGRLAPAIRLLELMNAPLSFIPDAMRDALGKVAILTLVNALAVLIYVLFVRH